MGVLIPNSLGDSGEKQGKTEDGGRGGTWILSCEPNTTNFLFCCLEFVVLLLLVVLLVLLAVLLDSELFSSMRASPIPFVLLGCSQECCEFAEMVFGFLLLLSTTQNEFAKAVNALVSRIEVGLIIGSLSVEAGDGEGEEEDDDEEEEEEEKKLLRNLGELRKNEVGFVDFSGGIHELLL